MNHFPQATAAMGRLRKAFREYLAMQLLIWAFQISPDACGDYIWSAIKQLGKEP